MHGCCRLAQRLIASKEILQGSQAEICHNLSALIQSCATIESITASRAKE